MLSIKNLSKKFGSKLVLDNVSVTVQKGDIAILLGASGVGKSTLLRILNNLESADTGTITLDGKNLDLSQLSKKHLCGMVFQQFNLFEHMTVLDNIAFALEKALGKSHYESTQIAKDLLAKYGLADKAAVYPRSLSGGQKQRLAIARSIALKPEIICFDEPTSALDPLLTNHVANNIAELAQEGFIVLIATHDTALLDKLNGTIYLMEHGNIIESASTHDFKNSPSIFKNIARFVAGNSAQ